MIICSNTFHFFASQKCQVDPGGHVPRAGGRGVIFQREISVIFQRGFLVTFQRGICYFPTQESCLGPAACISWITWTTWFLGFGLSWFLGFLVSWFLGFLVSGFLAFLFSGSPGFWVNQLSINKRQANTK